MMMSYRKLVLSCVSLVLLAVPVLCQDTWVYQESIENTQILPNDKRVPVENKDKCGPNEFYYPGDRESDWICDCKPTYLYVPERDDCFPAFQRAFCKNDEYLILPNDTFVPICQKNPCKNRRVPSEKGCVLIGANCHGNDSRRKYGVDEVTLKVICLQVPGSQATTTSVVNRFDDEDQPVQKKYCYPGCKRFQNGECTLKV